MPDWVLQLIGIVGGGAAVYAAIRADLAELRVKAEHAWLSADKAHERLDDWVRGELAHFRGDSK